MTPLPLTDMLFVDRGEVYAIGDVRCTNCHMRWMAKRVAGSDPRQIICPACQQYGVDHCWPDDVLVVTIQ